MNKRPLLTSPPPLYTSVALHIHQAYLFLAISVYKITLSPNQSRIFIFFLVHSQHIQKKSYQYILYPPNKSIPKTTNLSTPSSTSSSFPNSHRHISYCLSIYLLLARTNAKLAKQASIFSPFYHLPPSQLTRQHPRTTPLGVKHVGSKRYIFYDHVSFTALRPGHIFPHDAPTHQTADGGGLAVVG